MILQNERYKELSDSLGGMNQAHFESFFYWNNPLELKHWTMNVVEILMIVGAVLGLIHAIRWFRKHGDPSNICVWVATVIYILIIEPPIYFPEAFGLDAIFQVVFIHNEFTLGGIFNRTPLYIVALYPATIYTSFVLIQRLNIFDRPYGIWFGAISVGFVNHCFYEIFDHFGPQYGWWLWDYDLVASKPALGSVPLYSLVSFSFTGAVAFTYLAKRYILNYIARGHWTFGKLAWRTFTVGGLTPALLAVMSPHLLYSMVDVSANTDFVTVCYYLQLAVFAGVALYAINQSAVNDSLPRNEGGLLRDFTFIFPVIYLLVFAGLWLFAFAEYSGAVDGITSRGTPIGSLPYTVICFVGCVHILRAVNVRVANTSVDTERFNPANELA